MSAVAEGQALEPEDTPLRGRAPDTLPPPALAPSAPEMVFRPPAMVALGARAERGFQPIPAPPPSTIGMELARAEAMRAPREDTALTTIPRLDLPPKVVAELMVDVWRDPEHRAELLRAKALDESSWALSLKRLTLVIDQAAKAESPLIEEIVAAMRGRARPVPTS